MKAMRLSDCGSTTPPLANGSYQVTSTTYLATATAHCDTGYTLTGNRNVTCQASGTWSTNHATCNPVGMAALLFSLKVFWT